MTQQILAAELKGRVRKDDDLLLKIAKANGVRVDTVKRWLRKDDETLTLSKNLDIIRDAYGLSKDEQLTQEVELVV